MDFAKLTEEEALQLYSEFGWIENDSYGQDVITLDNEEWEAWVAHRVQRLFASISNGTFKPTTIRLPDGTEVHR